jgi:hypothetical protein
MNNRKIKKTEIITKCSVCQKDLKNRDIFVVRKDNGRAIFHLTCSNCHTAALVSITTDPHGIVGQGAVTDLSRSELKEKMSLDAITSVDIIDAYASII